ncbi:MAG: CBS domain-containing protein [Candidatus Micrarchaeaceae archaeon]
MEGKSSLLSELASDTVTVDYKTPITKVIPMLDKYEAVVVTRNGEYSGIIDSRSISRMKGLILKDSSAFKYAERTPQISDSTPMSDLIFYFYKTRRKALPYVRNGKIRGVLTRTTLLKMLLSLKTLNGIKVEEAMSSPVIAIDSEASLSQAKAAMINNKINRLVVLHDGKFIGLLTNHDLSLKYSVQGERLPEMKSKKYSPSNIRIMDVVEKNPVSVRADSDLAEAARQMVERSISSVLVQKGSNPIGMLTVFDILENLVAKQQVSERKVFISGLDDYTYEYGDDLREMLNAFIAKLEKMKNIKVNYMTLHIKRVKLKSYELQARLSIEKYGTISIHEYGEKLDRTLALLLSALKGKVVKYKEARIVFSKSAPIPDDEIGT